MQSKYKIFRYRPEEVEAMRKEYNLDTEEKREAAFKIIEEWLLKQDHHIKKKYSKEYLEKCLLTCKGSIERTKQQLDFICTARTLMPMYFYITHLEKSELVDLAQKSHAGYCPSLTKDRCRVIIVRPKPDVDITALNLIQIRHFFTITGELIKAHDYFQGFYLIWDMQTVNISEILMRVNFVEVRQFLPVCTEGYGCRVKGIIFITSNTLIEGLLKMLRPMFTEKLKSRLHVVNNKEAIKDFIFPNEILPADYGGSEKNLEDLHADLWETLNTEPVQELLKEMNAARTDESKRRQDKFNEQYMGMSGSFRTMTLD